MQLLYLFEKIRNPVFDFFFSAVTYLGDEIALMLIAITLFWCVNKRAGYYMLASGFFGILANQTMKLAFKIPRPWERDPSFTIVESAREAASGYSFPSGHSQNAVSTFGAVFLTANKKVVKILCIVAAILVPVSRMYLGVHTLWDVLAGSACAVVILLILEEIFKSDKLFDKWVPFIVGLLTLGTVAFFLYAVVFAPESTDPNALSAAKNAKTLLGCSAGLILVYPLDRFVIKFDTKSTWYGHIIKFVGGFVIVLLLKELLRDPFEALFGDYGRAIRYFVIVAFGGALWPLTFKYIAKLKVPVLDRFGERVAAFFANIFARKNRVTEADKSE
ncbi:MAG: phosphatase PAP2 family protein [Ruminococcaceae bacterium]|nr:phosphatase PAP2 family protein [Oscillospiraceae bacterium]